MVKKIQISMSNKSFYMFVTIGLMSLLCIGVYAYNSGASPSVMGHSADEIEVTNAFCNKITGYDCGAVGNNYYTKDEINVMISAIEAGGTGCPVGYTYYEQSTEAAKCYKDEEEIVARSSGDFFYPVCYGRIVNGVLQSRAECYFWRSDSSPISNWMNGQSSVICGNPAYTVYCLAGWNGVSGYISPSISGSNLDTGLSSWHNILQIN